MKQFSSLFNYVLFNNTFEAKFSNLPMRACKIMTNKKYVLVNAELKLIYKK